MPDPQSERKDNTPAKPAAVRVYVYRGEGTGLFQRCCWNFGRFLSQIAGAVLFSLRAKGTENVPAAGAVLMVTNHQSFLDPWLIGVRLQRQIHFMARDTLFKGGFLGWLLELLNSFPVKRGSADLLAIRTGIQRLEQGRVLNVFPEGTRSEDGSIGVLAPGIALILQRVTVPFMVMPVLIEGAFEAWPRTSKYPHRHPILMVYGTPIPSQEFKDMKAAEVAMRLRRCLVELQEGIKSPHAAASRSRLEADVAKSATGEPRGRAGRS